MVVCMTAFVPPRTSVDLTLFYSVAYALGPVLIVTLSSIYLALILKPNATSAEPERNQSTLALSHLAGLVAWLAHSLYFGLAGPAWLGSGSGVFAAYCGAAYLLACGSISLGDIILSVGYSL